jgi:NAD(P)-dependent dehydrogenase (short-subunit alcohol dehydrogenase family)
MNKLSDQVSIVTGAAGNLGKAVVETFLSNGAKVVCVDYDPERLEQVYSPGAGPANHLFVLSADLTQQEDAKKVAAETLEQFGRIDILVNTVGGYRAGTPLHETPVETWDGMLKLNARTVFLTSQAVIPHMIEQGTGKIVSIAARPGLSGRANMAAYSASKSAVIRLTESMSAELKNFGIRVNCIIPGTIDTPQNREEMPDADPQRWVKPESLADVVLFLCSEAARDIQGAAVPVYGRS